MMIDILFFRNADSDLDLLTDGRERYYKTDANIADVITEDWDGDGLNALEEQIYNTDP